MIEIDSEKEPTYVEIIPNADRKTAHVMTAYHVLHTKGENESQFSFYIPGFDIYFFSENLEEGITIGRGMIASFLKFWAKQGNGAGLILEINRLGFRTEHHARTMLNMVKLKKITKKEKFNTLRPSIPNEFVGAFSTSEKTNIALEF